jgi:DNA modification methylase
VGGAVDMGQLSLFAPQEEQKLIKPTLETEYGQLWQLGKHRLLVGNSRNRDDVLRLFDGAKADLTFTSPPYTDQRIYDGEPFNWTELMCETFGNVLAVAKPDIHILINLGMSHKNRRVDFYWNDWLDYCERAGWPLFGMYVWDKGSGMPHDNVGRLFSSHEFIFHFNAGGGLANKWLEIKQNSIDRGTKGKTLRYPDGSLKPFNSPDKSALPGQRIPDTVIRIPRENQPGIQSAHPAVFPIELPKFIYKTYSQPGDIVFEPFCGSGTSIVAAEGLNRICYAIEKHPPYAAIAIERWQRETKQKAILISEVTA